MSSSEAAAFDASHLEHCVDDEVLAVAAFVLEHAVVTAYAQPTQLDLIAHGRARQIAAIASAASTDGRTSWTRTPHTPASAQ